jgi:hypothetical protein
MKKHCLLLIFFFLTIGGSTIAQLYYPTQEEFGRNSIQRKRLKWKSIKSSNFEFIFYKGGEVAARKGLKMAEDEYGRITSVLGYTPLNTIKIYIYNNQKDLYRSNLGLNSVADSKGGTVDLNRSHIQLPFSKDEAVFKKDLIRYIARLCVYDMLYGGSVRDPMASSILNELPEWFTKGVSIYVAESWSPEKNQAIMSYLSEEKIKRISQLRGNDATIVGESIWNYISVRYGNDNVANVLNLTRIIRNEYKSISSTLGTPYNQFLKDWKDYYLTGKISNNSVKSSSKKDEIVSQNSAGEIVDRKKLELRDDEVDTYFYEFSLESLTNLKQFKPAIDSTKKVEKPSVISSRIHKNDKEPTKSKPAIDYINSFMVNKTGYDFVFDPLRKFGVKGSILMNDILETQELEMGGMVTPNLKNNDIFAEYTNKLSRYHFSLRYDRRSIDVNEVDGRNTYLFLPLGINLPANGGPYEFDRKAIMNKISLGMTWPVSRYFRISTSPFFMNAFEYGLGSNNLLRDTQKSPFIGNKAEVVLDNSQTFYGALMEGTKFKFQFENYINLMLRNSENFNRLRVDFRHYQPVGRAVLAFQVNYSQSGGNAPQRVVMGGVENWLNRRIDNKPNRVEVFPRDIRGLLFTDFAGSLRGFNAFKVIGNRHFLTNAELRLPVSYLLNAAPNNSFFKNLTILPFVDIGTAWMGERGPFKRQNSLNTQEIIGAGGAFRAVVTDFRNPFFYGYGVGARTKLLGRQIKVDYAWGLEDKVVSKPLLMLSIGNDF